jgi:hypothetical protein
VNESVALTAWNVTLPHELISVVGFQQDYSQSGCQHTIAISDPLSEWPIILIQPTVKSPRELLAAAFQLHALELP